ncbi:MAG: valine--tRNA ligase [Deltaproteobacteria bacterium]|nr:valine--tRNA ligase [Deltaproteobacteria bacterium]
MKAPATDLGTYDPHSIEEKHYEEWVRRGYFHADPASSKPPFSIVIPPPNVTGSLHMGHALNNTLQDVLVRYKRMDGFEALWMPGTDHAGIATQNVVERMLAAEGTSREELGREGFVERVWRWRAESGGTIIRQLRRLGASCDWERERFTMDEGLSRAVREVFCRLYEEGLIYRGDYITNWGPRCHTALSDLEVEHEDAQGRLWYIEYRLKDGSAALIVATTRPETMLGDTAVAVSPEDERYAGTIGKTLVLPLVGREIPVIADAAVDPAFGTGAVKVTPSHDPNDFAMAERHNLPHVVVIGKDGRMTEAAGAEYAGLDRYDARKKVLEALKAQGLLLKEDAHAHAVGHCYRCRTVVEPLVSRQWFVKIKPLAEVALKAVEEGRTRIVPEQWEKTYFRWMEGIRDWCISRQIWWGHRIPAFTCEACGELTVARADPTACPKCGSPNLARETDVLDTWFSSGLWPFSTLGWPDRTPELARFYPTSVLVTGFDILFFWVARMMMMGLKFMGDVPFRDVYIHALVRDEKGEKMSKTKGNVIDPLEVIAEYGADAFRFALMAFAAQGRDVKLSKERIAGYNRFVNKIWNATRFALMNLTDFDPEATEVGPGELLPQDRWIVGRLRSAVADVRRGLDGYAFNEAASAAYQFVWHEFCDWYIEMSKRPLYGASPRARLAAQQTLVRVLDGVFRLLHPLMPFVTEELWSRLPWPRYLGERPESLVIARFPTPGEYAEDEAASARVEVVRSAVSAIRNVRGEMNVPPSRKVPACFQGGEGALEVLRAEAEALAALAGLERVEFLAPGAPKPPKSAAGVAAGVEIFLPLEGIIDFAEEERRLRKEIEKLETEEGRIAGKLRNPQFTEKAPPAVVEKEKARASELGETLTKLRANLERIVSA